MEVEHDNLRAALEWSSGDEEDAEMRLRLAAALRWFWNAHTHWSEGRKWLEAALAGTSDRRSTLRVRALHGTGTMARWKGEYERALALHKESLALARELEDQTGMAVALQGCALVTLRLGDFDAATVLFAESLELSRKLEDKWIMTVVLALSSSAARYKKDYAKAVALGEESLVMFRTLGAKRGIAYALRTTGHARRMHGDLERAAVLYKDSLALLREVGDKWIATDCIEGLALVASARGHVEWASRLFGAAETARETFGITYPRQEAGDQDQFWAAIRERPEGTPFVAAWAEGRAMTLEQAVEYALEVQD